MQQFAFSLISLPSIFIATGIGAALSLGLGLILVIASQVFALPVDEKLEEIRSALPGANCGACGYSGCDAYAISLREGKETNVALCPVGGEETAVELAEILGLEPPRFIPQTAYVFCQGTEKNTTKRYHYSGIISCFAAMDLFSGPNSCTYGCIGFGDCVSACPYGALSLSEGIAFVNSSSCRACGLCVSTCPKNLIEIIPRHYNAYTVSCKNKWPGAQTRKNCKAGCIGCGRCARACPSNAITMDGPLAVIDQYLCTHCNQCLEVCPTHAIRRGLPIALGPDGEPIRSYASDEPPAPTPSLQDILSQGKK